jgi:dienelactone hydrolase
MRPLWQTQLSRYGLGQAQAWSPERLADVLRAEEVPLERVEAELRARPQLEGRPQLPRGKLIGDLVVDCLHVDYRSQSLLYLPRQYDPDRAWPLLVVAHGGNARMSLRYAQQAALMGLRDWVPLAEERRIILAAPLSQRGWSVIGNSLLFSLLNQLQGWLHLDPTRCYLTGHSMGGHLTWRQALAFPDRWGAFAPMSGGYDYVARGLMPMLANAAGYATFGSREPYDIDHYNRKMRAWLAGRGFDWQLVEKPGGHEIFADELPRVADFLLAHQRDLYPEEVVVVSGPRVAWTAPEEIWSQHRWHPAWPLRRATVAWCQLDEHPNLPADAKQYLQGRVDRAGQAIHLQSTNVHRARLFVHPKMLDLTRPIALHINQEPVRYWQPQPDLRQMLQAVHRFTDRLRLYHAQLELDLSGESVSI